MTDNTSYIDMLRKFGTDLGLRKLNVDEFLQTQKKNLDTTEAVKIIQERVKESFEELRASVRPNKTV